MWMLKSFFIIHILHITPDTEYKELWTVHLANLPITLNQ